MNAHWRIVAAVPAACLVVACAGASGETHVDSNDAITVGAGDVVGTIAYGQTKFVEYKPDTDYKALCFDAAYHDKLTVKVFPADGAMNVWLIDPSQRTLASGVARAGAATTLSGKVERRGRHCVAVREQSLKPASLMISLAGEAEEPGPSFVVDPSVDGQQLRMLLECQQVGVESDGRPLASPSFTSLVHLVAYSNPGVDGAGARNPKLAVLSIEDSPGAGGLWLALANGVSGAELCPPTRETTTSYAFEGCYPAGFGGPSALFGQQQGTLVAEGRGVRLNLSVSTTWFSGGSGEERKQSIACTGVAGADAIVRGSAADAGVDGSP